MTRSGGAIHLTFDDGPDPRGTPEVLAALARAGAGATFFVIARSAAEHPELIGRIAADGHGIELHCDMHVRHSDQDEPAVRADLSRALHTLDGLGIHPTRWRTPWGDRAPFTERLAAEHALTLVDWDLDTVDWRGDRAGKMFAATRRGLTGGAIVLAHDGIGPGARRTDAAQTAAYVERVAAHAARQGLALEPLA